MPRRSDPAEVPSLAEVARRAGVSAATASRAIHGAAGRAVSPELRDRVLAAAAELGYVVNPNAQAMARGRADVLGLIVQDIGDPYFSTVAAGVMREARASTVLVTLGDTQRDPAEELAYVRAFRSNRARAIVIVGSRTSHRAINDELAAELARFSSEGGRAVAVTQPRVPIDVIAVDNRGGAAGLAGALHDLGYRRFGILAGPEQLLTAAERTAGFREGLAGRGVHLFDEEVSPGSFVWNGGYDTTAELLKGDNLPECLFAVNDVMALGAMACLREHGVRVPEDIAVAGFDDIPTLRDVTPGLTTVRIDLDEIGRKACRLALSDAARVPRIETLTGETVIRASTPEVNAPVRRPAGTTPPA
ncbi:LacI family DNA-binding transcriptional regulator [Amycolatopsis cihanbeyliensis]|uniref:LacI family transcriptional regulator n=1 Tax=Amycolatopsis cihanbeyliensis TaxID=1128664 RepID=A0A542DQF0_AMYCI|nr:LacI family DNA-binding transcriptional regulator [Amycolatopsis cihanbeyliensis]TQJ05214.1 LacI family transcriptional regulator [Amycolatopsis cihanbeyliensis]